MRRRSESTLNKLQAPTLFLLLSLLLSACDPASVVVEPIPALDSLEITGGQTSLNPNFRADRARYSMIADDLSPGLSITASAGANLTISINDTLATSGVPYVLNTISHGDVIDISVQTRSGTRKDYEVLYLPPDFPELVVGILEPGVAGGLIYLTLRGESASYATVIDNHGVPVFYRREDRAISDFKRHANGQRSYALRTGERTSTDRVISEHVIFDAAFNELRRVRTSGLEHTDHHEFHITPNGHSILLSYEPATRDLTAFGGAADAVVEDSVIQEIDETGQVLYEWNSWGRILYADELRGDASDYAHVNSIVVDADDNWIISARGTSQVSKIEKSSSTLLWTLGGKSNQFTFINDPYGNICGQHTASRLENGNILIFDNGQYCWPENPSRVEHTRVVEFDLDETNMTAELVWSYSRPDTYTLSGGSAQRLENGNTLISWNRGPDVLATEVDANGNVVFELTGVDLATGESVRSYRALRFAD